MWDWPVKNTRLGLPWLYWRPLVLINQCGMRGVLSESVQFLVQKMFFTARTYS